MKAPRPAVWGTVLACGLSLLIPAAQASLIGTTVDITATGGFLQSGGCTGVTVDGNVECRIGNRPDLNDDVIDIDIGDSNIVFEFLDPSGPVGIFAWGTPDVFDVVIDGLTWVNDPTAAIASIDVSTQLFGSSGGGSIQASLTGDNQVTLNFNDLRRVLCSSCARLTVDITPKHDVPTPGTLALLGLGLAGLGTVRRRRT